MSRSNLVRSLAIAGFAISVAYALVAQPGFLSRPSGGSAPARTSGVSGDIARAPVRASLAASSASSASTAGITAAALTPAQAGADPFFVEPRVPRAAGTPCVDTIVTNLLFTEQESIEQGPWTPSCANSGPWAKIVLVVETTGPRDPSAFTMRVEFLNTDEGQTADPVPGGGTLFMGGPHQHELVGTWRFERDVTEYADALHRGLRIVYGIGRRDNAYQDFGDGLDVIARSVKLIYYPASTSTPAQRTADAMRSLASFGFLSSAGWTFDTLPRNIERVYLDVMARPLEPRVWYSCVPTASMTTFPQLDSRFGMGDYRPFLAGPELGCSAEDGSYKEVEVLIDDQLAGLAPVFPAIPSRINFTDAIDYPAPAVQALNIMPFRVDLTPFAALLNDGQPHSIVARVTNSSTGYGAEVTGQLLLYLDEARSVVTGALTRNTLASQPSNPSITNSLALSGNTVQGTITTFLRREFNIEGYVDTSKGRVRSTVYQVSRFQNTQTLRVVGPATFPTNVPYAQEYAQSVRLSNTVDRVMRRTRGTTLLSEDKDYTTYPLTMDFASGGNVQWFESLPAPFADHFDLDAHHARAIRASHFRPGQTRYDTRLADVFDGSHHWRDATQTDPGGDFDWNSTRRYLFTDNRGSCYSAGITTTNGELQTRTRGTECPNGTNGLRWYAHPDGAPEAMLWAAFP